MESGKYLKKVRKKMESEYVRAIVMENILAEREFNTEKVRNFRNKSDVNDFWTVILAEELGEIAKKVRKNNTAGMYNRLIQCAGICMAWAEAYHEDKIKKEDK
jgi:hypothetical protein